MKPASLLLFASLGTNAVLLRTFCVRPSLAAPALRGNQRVDRLELPSGATDALWATRTEFQKRRSEILRTVRDPEARLQQLIAPQQEAIAPRPPSSPAPK